MALADAAADAGIGLTMLPVLYERAGFVRRNVARRSAPLRSDARRPSALRRAFAPPAARSLNAGLAIHSLRAASAASIAALRALADASPGPIHIHVAEQSGEVDDVPAATGQRPMEWLARKGVLDARWQLVHATHASADEIAAVAASGAGIVLCPSTEANLGDGVLDLPGWLAAGVPLAIGSDSQVTRDWREELRLLEYGATPRAPRRNVAAAPRARRRARPPSGSSRECCKAARARRDNRLGPRRRCARRRARRRSTRRRAARPASGALARRAGVQQPVAPWRDVMVAGRWVIEAGAHASARAMANHFAAALDELAADSAIRRCRPGAEAATRLQPGSLAARRSIFSIVGATLSSAAALAIRAAAIGPADAPDAPVSSAKASKMPKVDGQNLQREPAGRAGLRVGERQRASEEIGDRGFLAGLGFETDEQCELDHGLSFRGEGANRGA